jgi:hypothetical protein
MSDEKAASEEGPPKRWWLTPYGRSTVDFDWISSPEANVPFFSQIETVEAYVIQRKTLAKSAEIFLVLSFLGASLILAGGLPDNTNISIFGFEGPSKMVSIPLLAALVAGIFSRYVQLLCSLSLITMMIEKLVGRYFRDGAEFVVASYDATYLWMNLLRKRTVGYQSPAMHSIVAALIPIAGLAFLFVHTVVVFAAMTVAIRKTYEEFSFGFFIAAMAMTMTVVATIIMVVAILVPAPYRRPDEVNSKTDSPKTVG